MNDINALTMEEKKTEFAPNDCASQRTFTVSLRDFEMQACMYILERTGWCKKHGDNALVAYEAECGKSFALAVDGGKGFVTSPTPESEEEVEDEDADEVTLPMNIYHLGFEAQKTVWQLVHELNPTHSLDMHCSYSRFLQQNQLNHTFHIKVPCAPRSGASIPKSPPTSSTFRFTLADLQLNVIRNLLSQTGWYYESEYEKTGVPYYPRVVQDALIKYETECEEALLLTLDGDVGIVQDRTKTQDEMGISVQLNYTHLNTTAKEDLLRAMHALNPSHPCDPCDLKRTGNLTFNHTFRTKILYKKRPSTTHGFSSAAPVSPCFSTAHGDDQTEKKGSNILGETPSPKEEEEWSTGGVPGVEPTAKTLFEQGKELQENYDQGRKHASPCQEDGLEAACRCYVEAEKTAPEEIVAQIVKKLAENEEQLRDLGEIPAVCYCLGLFYERTETTATGLHQSAESYCKAATQTKNSELRERALQKIQALPEKRGFSGVHPFLARIRAAEAANSP